MREWTYGAYEGALAADVNRERAAKGEPEWDIVGTERGKEMLGSYDLGSPQWHHIDAILNCVPPLLSAVDSGLPGRRIGRADDCESRRGRRVCP